MSRIDHHPFVPQALQSPKFLKWLRRTHAWFGITGGAAGLIFAITAITLSHDNFGVDAEPAIQEFELAVPVGTNLDSQEALGSFVGDALGLRTQWRIARGAGMGMGGTSRLTVRFSTSGANIDAVHLPGSEVVSVARQDYDLLTTINRMHLGTGAPLGWIIMGDFLAGALFFLSISGLLMWTRIHGNFLLAISLITVTAVVSAFYFSVGA